MDIVTHLSVNLFPVCMLAILYLNNQKKGTRKTETQLFQQLILMTGGLIALDVAAGFLNEWQDRTPVFLFWLVHILNAVFSAMVPCQWFLYLRYRIYGKEPPDRINIARRILQYVFAGYVAFTALTPWTHLIFSITDDRIYRRECLFFIPELFSGVVFLTSSFLAYAALNRASRSALRQEYRFLMQSALFPLAGILADTIRTDWCITAPCMSVGILFLYIKTQNQQITTDGLTGLNNRREFDRYLRKKTEQDRTDWGILMIDVDDFKLINDRHGHSVGDEALWATAGILRRAASGEPVFLARYGGDEFSVIGEWETPEDARHMMQRIHSEAELFRQKTGKPYSLSLSIGYAMWSEIADQTTAGLIAKADERMYRQKTDKKESTRAARLHRQPEPAICAKKEDSV